MNIERRSDHSLRKSINNIQAQLLERPQVSLLFSRLLKEALAISASRYGYVLDICPTARGVFVDLQCVMSAQVGTYHSLSCSLEDRVPRDVLASVLESHEPVALNDDASLGALNCRPTEAPHLKHAFIHPIIDERQVLALLVLANAPEPYSMAFASRLRSLLTAFVCVKRVASSAVVTNPGVSPYQNKHLVNLITASLNGVVTVNADHEVTTFNFAAEKIFGMKASAALGKPLSSFIDDDFSISQMADAHYTAVGTTTLSAAPRVWHGVKGKRSNGQRFVMDVSVFYTRYGESLYTTFILDDISDRIESARESQESLQRFQTLTNLAPVGIVQVNRDWSCTYANDKWCELTGLSHNESLGNGWVDAIHPDCLESTLTELRDAVSIGESFMKEFRLQTPLGVVTWVKAAARAVYDDKGDISGFLATIADITDHRNTEEKLRQIAEFDALTGLVNRPVFMSRLDAAFEASARRGDVAVLFIDLDGFKSINDTLGHDAGDALLIGVAQRLRRAVREEDTVARLGGDEFTVTLNHIEDPACISKVAEKIIKKLKVPFHIAGSEVFVTASVGISVGNSDSSDPSTLIKQADIALYRAKEQGRCNYQFFTPELDAQAKALMFIRNSLHRALERQELSIVYQPQVTVKEGYVSGFEALLRWDHPALGAVMPTQFVPLLEETGLIESVGAWILREACGQLKKWQLDGLIDHEVTMSVNVSPRQLKDASFAPMIESTLENLGLLGEQLVLEMTETALIEKMDDAVTVLQGIKALGVRIALDDFGTGYSSLAYLAQLPIDYLKVDQSFIASIPDEQASASVVEAIIAMAKRLGLTVVAEGVESREKLAFLEREACDDYQGFFFARPAAAGDIEALLEQERKKRHIDHYKIR